MSLIPAKEYYGKDESITSVCSLYHVAASVRNADRARLARHNT